MQHCLTQTHASTYDPTWHLVSVAEIVQEIQFEFMAHPAAKNKTLTIELIDVDAFLRTDYFLLFRVLNNMVLNALEATAEHGKVRLWIEQSGERLAFCVWNSGVIPADIARHVFRRNFSSKQTEGRGLGTYSMKLFGEKFLRGTVSFTASESEGTVFRFSLDLQHSRQPEEGRRLPTSESP